ncbi:MAG: 23S rRNA (uridine(2552)-2'-O)-methyltransferase RlmE [Legionellaceae bacterium]|nr:23S rRNA (uridine(2552)-2'-O)-methyltransferase RlmE [Legionellaceae bacterium]
MPRSKSSKRWLQEHFDDPFVKKAQAEGYRSRAVYKLIELDERERLLRPGMGVIDLGAAPGGWTQYVSRRLDGNGRIIALDILAMDALADVAIITGDFQDEQVLQQLLALLPAGGVDLILSDMAPNMSGNPAVDIPRAMALVELALDLCSLALKANGTLLMKVFHGEGFDELLKQVRHQFTKVSMRKPKASRPRSRETYLLAKGFKMV